MMRYCMGFLRFLGVLIYDLLILSALLLVTTILGVLFHHGTAIPPHNLLFQGALATVIAAYFFLSWKIHGQTIGMRAWRKKA